MGAVGSSDVRLIVRILNIADVNPSRDSGAAGTEYETVLALKRAGHSVTDVWSDELTHGIKHFNLRYLLELPRALRKVMLRHMSSQTFDVVQISQPHGYLAAKALLQEKNQARFVHRSHGFEPRGKAVIAGWRLVYPESRPIIRKLASRAMDTLLESSNRGIARYADGHLVSASECADFLHEHYAVSRERAVAIPQSVPQSYREGSTPISLSRITKLLYVGQFAFFKAPMVLAQVLNTLLVKNPSLTFTWVCSRAHHGSVVNLLDPAILGRVTLLDWMPQDQLLRVYDEHGIFVFPSFFEGFGKVFLEAMSRGLVVVASRNGGMKDVLIDGENGRLVDAGDVPAFVAAVESVLNDFELARSISMQAIQSTQDLHWDGYASRCTAFYERLGRLPKVMSF